MIQKALVKAFEVHGGVCRKGSNTPYFVHILDVAKYLMYDTMDEEVICAGILHDTLEDSSYSKEELLNDFGSRVLSLVEFCTEPGNTVDMSEEFAKNSWKNRKMHSIQKLKSASESELLVFTSDKVANLLSIKEDLLCDVDVWSKFNSSKKDQEWYYRSILIEIKDKLKSKRMLTIYENLVGEVFGKNKFYS